MPATRTPARSVRRRAAPDRLEQVGLVLRDREQHYLDLGQFGIDGPGGLEAIAAWHVEIEHDDVWMERARLLEGLVTVPRRSHHRHAAGEEQVAQPVEEQRMIVGEQHAHTDRKSVV